jgi:hypothetical protein
MHSNVYELLSYLREGGGMYSGKLKYNGLKKDCKVSSSFEIRKYVYLSIFLKKDYLSDDINAP